MRLKKFNNLSIYSSILCLIYFLMSKVRGDCGEPLKRICYYTSWGGVLPSPPNLCTHVIYAFANIESGVLSGIWSNPLKDLKKQNKDVKLMVAVGGWGFGVEKMTLMLKDESSRKRFVDDSVDFLRKFEFDGLDLDFEYPGINSTEFNRFSPPEDKQRFTLLCKELREKFDQEKPPLLLSAALGCRKPDIDNAYEIEKISEYLDFLNLMTYDLRGASDEMASHHSALYSGSYEEGEQKVFNQDWVINYFISNGAPPEKLILGIAFYGKSFIWNSDARMIGGPAKYGDFVGYKTVCGYLNSKWKRIWLEDQQVPFVFQGNVMVGYDDVESIGIKINYTINRGLGGVMVWSLDYDDSNGYGCNQGKFPLLTKIYDLLQNESTICTTTKSTTTLAPELAILNRTHKMITPRWKKSSTYVKYKNFKSRIGQANKSSILSPFSTSLFINHLYLIIFLFLIY